MLASLSISRIIVLMLPSSVVIPHGMTPAQRHGTCGTRALTVPSASRRGGYRIQPRALLARHLWPTCGKTPRRPLLATMGAIKIGARRGRVSTTSCRPTTRPDQLPPRLRLLCHHLSRLLGRLPCRCRPTPLRPNVGVAHEHDVDVPVGDEESPKRLVGVGLVDGG